MSNRYRVTSPTDENPLPRIVLDQTASLTWRDAKKLLRSWFLDEAKRLRKVTEDTYFQA